MIAERETDQGLLVSVVSPDGTERHAAVPSPATSQHMRYLGGTVGALGLITLGAVLALHTMPQGNVGTDVQIGGVMQLAAASKDSCPVPKTWCKGTKQRHDTLSHRDCDGDGILDPYCEGGELLRFGFISSKNNCEDNWPNGLCSREKPAGKEQQSSNDHAASNEITVIHFNDVYNVAGVLEGSRRSGGMSRAVHVVNQARKRNPDRTFVVFAGDLLSPSVLSDMFEGKQMVDILNSFKLDAASLGNHEFDFGVDTLGKRLQESNFPWLNINLMDENSKLLPHTTKHFAKDVPWSPRWNTDKEGTAKVCFFGVAYDVRETMFKDVDRIKFKDVMEASKAEVDDLKNTEKCDVVIPLTHQFSKEDCALSKELGDKVDLILGGHDHSTEFTSVCGHAPYVKAASDLKTQWVMTLWLSDEGKVESVDGRLLSLTDADPFDVVIHDKIVEWEEKGEKEMGKNMGCLKVDLDARNSKIRQSETNMADFFCDAVRGMHGTDVALVNGGTMRGDKIFKSGDLSKKTLTEMHPFGNAVAKIYATGKELKTYINMNLDCWQNVCGNFVQVSGLKYEFDPTLPAGKRLTKLMTEDGKDIDDEKKFTVAITDFMLANSPMKKNKLFNMVTLNDAVPLVQALFDATKKAGDSCITTKIDGRIKNLKP